MLIDKALAVRGDVLLPLAALTTVGTGWSLAGPPSKGKRSWPSPGGRGNHSLSYERSRVQRRSSRSLSLIAIVQAPHRDRWAPRLRR
jgi:hypothetical protein